MRIVITGGGTGGHLYPALAVCEALLQQPDVELLYIGNRHKREAELVPQYSIRFEGLLFSGMPRRLSPALFTWGIGLVRAFFEARRLLKDFRPNVVFGTGGYVTAPVLLAALSLRIPYGVHEPDAHPGLVNRTMSRWAAVVTCAFAGAKERLKAQNLHVTGNPLRSRIGRVGKDEALSRLGLPFQLDRPVLLVVGGSQGARKINRAVLEALPRLVDDLGMQIIHQTGETLYDETLSQCPEAYRNHQAYHVLPFIEDMASTLALADIALCRSGSLSLSEMYLAHIPTILAPYPFASADHQRKNALASQEAGASVMIEDAALTGETLLSVLVPILQNPQRLQTMKQAARALSAPQATQQIMDLLQSVAHRS